MENEISKNDALIHQLFRLKRKTFLKAFRGQFAKMRSVKILCHYIQILNADTNYSMFVLAYSVTTKTQTRIKVLKVDKMSSLLQIWALTNDA